MSEARWKAVAVSLAQQRNDAVRGYGDIIADLSGQLAEAHERITELDAELAKLREAKSDA